MKISLKSFIVLFISFIFISSCKKDEDEIIPVPSFNNLEIGTDNNKTAYPGSDIHIEAEILAPATIASVKLEIHPQSGEGWSYEQEYTEGFSGLKNAEFHKHIDIPAEAPLGLYHVHLSVTDALGQSTELESELELKFDPSLPVVTGLEVSPNTAGTDLHLEAVISATNKIAKVVVEVHGSAWEKEFEFTDAAMVGQTTYNFHKHVNITEAPAGHYHVHVKVVDQQGKENEFEEHFDKN